MKKILGLGIIVSVAATSVMGDYHPYNLGCFPCGTYIVAGGWQFPSSYPANCQVPEQGIAAPTQSGCSVQAQPSQEQAQPNMEQAQPNQDQPQGMNQSLEQQHPNLIVMFTKNQCPYCVYMKPIMQEVEGKFGKDIKFLYVDIDQNPQYVSQYGFSTVPHIIYFKDGKKLDAHGSDDKTITAEQVAEKINTYFGAN